MGTPKSARKLYLKIVSSQTGKPLKGVKVELLALPKAQSDKSKSTKSRRKVTTVKGKAAQASNPMVTLLGDLTSNAMGLVAFSNRSIWEAANNGIRLEARFNDTATFALNPDGLKALSELGPIRIALNLPEMAADVDIQSDFSNWQDGGLNSTDFISNTSMFPGFEDLEFGGDACSRLIPNDQTLREFDHKNIFVTERDVLQCGELNIHRGEIIDFSVVWKRLGYSFGDLIYSLALAPGEHVTLALSSWEQRQFASASRDTISQESSVGTYSRANSLTETMDMSSKNFSFGASLGLSANLGKIPITAALGLSTNIERKSVSANSSRIFSDNIQQTAQRMRHDRQTIIVEQVETEDQSLSYRTVCNRNYCHVLNVFYHEVLENHRVTTYLMGHQNALLVPYDVKHFDERRAFCTHAILAKHILDPCIDNCCEALKRHLFSDSDEGTDSSNSTDKKLANRIRLDISIGSDGQKGGQGFAVLLYFKNGKVREIDTPHGSQWKNGQYHVDASTTAFDPADVIKVGVKNNNSWGIKPSIDVNSYTVSFFAPDGSGPKALGTGSKKNLKREKSHSVSASYIPTVPPPTPISPTNSGPTPEEDAACVAAYVEHLNCHKHYYNAILWMLEDRNQRISRFENIICSNGERLIDLVDPTPLGVYGNQVAFAEAGSLYEPDDEQGVVDDRLVVLPTSGIFADVALGQCNACEELPEDDNHPFWKIYKDPNKCDGNAAIVPTKPSANSLFGSTGVGFVTPSTTAWASAPSAPTDESITNSLSAAFTAEVAKALTSSSPAANLKDLATVIEKISKVSKELKSGNEDEEPAQNPTESQEDAALLLAKGEYSVATGKYDAALQAQPPVQDDIDKALLEKIKAYNAYKAAAESAEEEFTEPSPI